MRDTDRLTTTLLEKAAALGMETREIGGRVEVRLLTGARDDIYTFVFEAGDTAYIVAECKGHIALVSECDLPDPDAPRFDNVLGRILSAAHTLAVIADREDYFHTR